MTPADRIRAAVSAIWDASPATPTADDLAAAVCEALADVVVPLDPDEALNFTTEAIRLNRNGINRSIRAIAADLRGEVGHG